MHTVWVGGASVGAGHCVYMVWRLLAMLKVCVTLTLPTSHGPGGRQPVCVAVVWLSHCSSQEGSTAHWWPPTPVADHAETEHSGEGGRVWWGRSSAVGRGDG